MLKEFGEDTGVEKVGVGGGREETVFLLGVVVEQIPHRLSFPYLHIPFSISYTPFATQIFRLFHGARLSMSGLGQIRVDSYNSFNINR